MQTLLEEELFYNSSYEATITQMLKLGKVNIRKENYRQISFMHVSTKIILKIRKGIPNYNMER